MKRRRIALFVDVLCRLDVASTRGTATSGAWNWRTTTGIQRSGRRSWPNCAGRVSAAALRTRQPEVGPALVERVEAAQASTRQELGAVRERQLAQMEALLRSPGRAMRDARPVPTAVLKMGRGAQVAELQAALQAERNHTEQLEQEQARLEEKSRSWRSSLRDRPVADAGSARELSRRDAAARLNSARELEAALEANAAGERFAWSPPLLNRRSPCSPARKADRRVGCETPGCDAAGMSPRRGRKRRIVNSPSCGRLLQMPRRRPRPRRVGTEAQQALRE